MRAWCSLVCSPSSPWYAPHDSRGEAVRGPQCTVVGDGSGLCVGLDSSSACPRPCHWSNVLVSNKQCATTFSCMAPLSACCQHSDPTLANVPFWGCLFFNAHLCMVSMANSDATCVYRPCMVQALANQPCSCGEARTVDAEALKVLMDKVAKLERAASTAAAAPSVQDQGSSSDPAPVRGHCSACVPVRVQFSLRTGGPTFLACKQRLSGLTVSVYLCVCVFVCRCVCVLCHGACTARAT